MKRFIMLGTAALALAACGDGGSNPVSANGLQPALAEGPSGPKYTVFTTQTPASFVSASGGWEVATRFKSSAAGRIVGFRFWRAPNETGSNQAKLWTNGGTLLRTAPFPHSGRAGWDSVLLSANQPRVAANTYYRVSVNTNATQAKTFGSSPFTINNGPLTADNSYYGQPAGSFPTTGSYSRYFVDVIFIPDGAVPNLYVASITRTNVNEEESVVIRVCNNGTAAADSSTLRMEHNVAFWPDVQDVETPGIAAGACVNLTPEVDDGPDGYHSYHVWADDDDVIYESNENDNERAI